MAAAVLVLGLGLAACGESNTPEAYDSIVEKNFLEGCTNQSYTLTDDTLATTDGTLSPDVTGGTDEQCRCQYDVFVEMVPYNSDTPVEGYTGPTFSELNNALSNNDDPTAEFDQLPADVRDALQSCPLPAQPADDAAGDDDEATTEE